MGIGEATARALAKAGANLILLSRSEVSIISRPPRTLEDKN